MLLYTWQWSNMCCHGCKFADLGFANIPHDFTPEKTCLFKYGAVVLEKRNAARMTMTTRKRRLMHRFCRLTTAVSATSYVGIKDSCLKDTRATAFYHSSALYSPPDIALKRIIPFIGSNQSHWGRCTRLIGTN